ncbi:hypothetical protein XELAEV_18039868mg [Xenopus laevis]|uniref:Uncharacterized protein n=1 Tax=Xenopus laevis TaxID=8355 RepID=A0A974H8A8_XENLA|nr:hypothetical protein XELAEV_18039868mg [Xenopus laevis]
MQLGFTTPLKVKINTNLCQPQRLSSRVTSSLVSRENRNRGKHKTDGREKCSQKLCFLNCKSCSMKRHLRTNIRSDLHIYILKYKISNDYELYVKASPLNLRD